MFHLDFFLGCKASMQCCIFQIGLIFLLACSSCYNLYAQKSIINQYNYQKFESHKSISYYKQTGKAFAGYEKYCPDTTLGGHTPWRVININVHFIAKSDSSGNFNQVDGREYAHQMVNVANEFLRNNKPAQLPVGNNIPVRPINLAYNLKGLTPNDDGIYFHYNDSIYNLFNVNDNSLYNTYMYDVYGIQKNKVINVFMVEQNNLDTLPLNKNPAGAVGISFGGFVKINHSYLNYKRPQKNEHGQMVIQHGWSAARSLNHEVGHSLGLMHSWNNDDCNDTPNNNNCYGFDTLTDCRHFSNNVMDYNLFQNCYTPCQIGKIHYLCTQTNSPQRKWLDSIWCTAQPNQVLWLNAKDTVVWNVDKELTNSIVLLNKTVLIVQGNISIPQHCEIVLHPHSTLIVDGGLIYNSCNLKWKGIRLIKKNRKTARVTFINNGKLLHTE